MAKKPETVFKEKVQAFLKAFPNMFVMKVQQQALRGDPDLFIICWGRTVLVELKKDAKAKADPLQLYRLRQGARAGAYAMVLCPETYPDFTQFVRSLVDGRGAPQEIPACLRLPSET